MKKEKLHTYNTQLSYFCNFTLKKKKKKWKAKPKTKLKIYTNGKGGNKGTRNKS